MARECHGFSSEHDDGDGTVMIPGDGVVVVVVAVSFHEYMVPSHLRMLLYPNPHQVTGISTDNDTVML